MALVRFPSFPIGFGPKFVNFPLDIMYGKTCSSSNLCIKKQKGISKSAFRCNFPCYTMHKKLGILDVVTNKNHCMIFFGGGGRAFVLQDGYLHKTFT